MVPSTYVPSNESVANGLYVSHKLQLQKISDDKAHVCEALCAHSFS